MLSFWFVGWNYDSDPNWSKTGVYAYSFGQLSGVHWLLCSKQSNPVKYVKSLTWAWAFWHWSPGYSPPPPNVMLPSVLLLWTGTVYFCKSHYLQLSIMRRKRLLWPKSAYLWSFALCFVRHCWVNEEQEQNTEVISLSKAGKFEFRKDNYLGQVKYGPYRWCWILLAKVYFIVYKYLISFLFDFIVCIIACYSNIKCTAWLQCVQNEMRSSVCFRM